MAHQKLLRALRIGFCSLCFVAWLFPQGGYALDFVPGNWQITNWIELPDGRKAKEQTSEECLIEPLLEWECEEPDCRKEEYRISGNDFYFTYVIEGNLKSFPVTGTIKFRGDSFEGIMQYGDLFGSDARVMTRGQLIGSCN
jgi:hypothetical protein